MFSSIERSTDQRGTKTYLKEFQQVSQELKRNYTKRIGPERREALFLREMMRDGFNSYRGTGRLSVV
jgi:hypothetical protein